MPPTGYSRAVFCGGTMGIFSDHAQEYWENGMCPIPIDTKSKRAYTPEWSKWCSTYMLGDELSDLILNEGHANIGLCLGKSPGVIALDIDILDYEDSEIYQELLSMLPPLQCGKIGNPNKPPTRFYSYNGEPNRKFRALGIELLSTGAQTVVPPSKHETHGSYNWIGLPLLEALDDLQNLPSDVVNWLDQKNDELKGTSGSIELTPGKGRCNHGSHNVISALGVALIKENYPFDLLVNRLMQKDKQINFGADSYYFLCPTRKWKSNDGKKNAEMFVDEIFRNHGPGGKHFGDNKGVDFKKEIDEGFTKVVIDNNREKKVRQYLKLYEYFDHKHSGVYLPDKKAFAIWTGKQFEFKAIDFAKMFAQRFFKNPECININERSTFLDLCKNSKQESVNEYTLQDKGVINMLNGMYLYNKDSFIPHDRKYKMSVTVNVEYDKKATCPTWDKLLSLICKDRPHLVQAIEEFVGYCLSGASYRAFNKMLILDGTGSNGKSTLLRVINNLLGEENCGALDLMSIGKERFSAMGLVGKLLNVCAEIPKEAFGTTGKIKQLTGGDPITVEEKGAGFYQYENIAKFIITYNKMPFFPDNSPGMRRRMIVIPCEQNFDENPELRLPDPDEYITKHERSGVFNKCITAYIRAKKIGKFIELDESKERIDALIYESNTLQQFIDQEIQITNSGDDFIPSQTLWDKFLEFRGRNTARSKNLFINEFLTTLVNHSGVTSGRKWVNMLGVRKYPRGIFGVKFTDEPGELTNERGYGSSYGHEKFNNYK